MPEDFKELAADLQFLDAARFPWFICGGWAIDLFLGRKTREHGDLEIGTFRQYQQGLRDYFSDWNLSFIQHGKTYAWCRSTILELPIHELEAKKNAKKLEILLNEADDTYWYYRRMPEIRHALHSLVLESENGLYYLAPEVVLLYKTKNTRLKDSQDFEASLEYLNDERKTWLKQSLKKVDPQHVWLEKLQ